MQLPETHARVQLVAVRGGGEGGGCGGDVPQAPGGVAGREGGRRDVRFQGRVGRAHADAARAGEAGHSAGAAAQAGAAHAGARTVRGPAASYGPASAPKASRTKTTNRTR